MFNLYIKKLNDKFILPKYDDLDSAGLDLYAIDNMTIDGLLGIISLGFATSFDKSFVGIIIDRSSMALKGLHIIAGVIDSSYRGEWKVVMINLGYSYEIKEGDKIAQVIFLPKIRMNILESEELDLTERGASCFGSTGK